MDSLSRKLKILILRVIKNLEIDGLKSQKTFVEEQTMQLKTTGTLL